MKKDIPPPTSPFLYILFSAFTYFPRNRPTKQRVHSFFSAPPPKLDKCTSIRQYIERKGELQQDKLSFEGISNGEKTALQKFCDANAKHLSLEISFVFCF